MPDPVVDGGGGSPGDSSPSGGQGGGADGGGGAAAEGNTFLSSLADDIRGDASLQKFDSVDALAREHVNLQGLIGRKGVILPGEDATEDDLNRFYTELGRPEKPEDYDFKAFAPPEDLPWDPALQDQMMPSFHKHGLTQAQAAGILADYAEMMGGGFTDRLGVADQAKETTTGTLKELWGDSFDDRLAEANSAVKEGFGEHLDAAKELVLEDGTPVLSHPLIAQAFQQLGAVMGEDALIGDGGAPPRNLRIDTPEAAQAEIDRIRGEARKDKAHAYNDAKHPDHKKLHQRVMELQKVATPGNVGIE